MINGLVVQNISQTCNNRPVLRDVSLHLHLGEIVGLFGPNGAGKTTCFNTIIGLNKPESGNIILDNHNITKLPIYLRARLGLGYLPQESSIFRGLSTEDNIKAILEINNKDNLVIEQKLDQLLTEFSISHLRHKPALALSGGERRRLEIARALAANPKFILLDEPFAGIDPLAIYDIKKLIIHLKAKNIGILITDHNVRDTLDIVDRAYIIYDGMVLMDGKPDEIISSSKVKEVYLGQTFLNYNIFDKAD